MSNAFMKSMKTWHRPSWCCEYSLTTSVCSFTLSKYQNLKSTADSRLCGLVTMVLALCQSEGNKEGNRISLTRRCNQTQLLLADWKSPLEFICSFVSHCFLVGSTTLIRLYNCKQRCQTACLLAETGTVARGNIKCVHCTQETAPVIADYWT